MATLYGLVDTEFIARFVFAVGFCGIVAATICYLFTEFALRPVAARALEAGRTPRRFAPGIMGRTLTVWLLGSERSMIVPRHTAYPSSAFSSPRHSSCFSRI